MRKTMRKSLTAFTLVIFMILSSVTPIFSDGFTESMGWTMPPFEGQQVIMGAGGEAHSAAILADGSLWTWGVNNVGQIGDGTTINRNRPQRIMEDAIFVALGSGFTMAIKSDNSLWGWGWLVDGEIVHSPIKIMDDVIYVSAGFRYVMIIKADGSLLGWGRNNVGQLGDGTTIDRHSPIKIMDDVKYVSTGLGYFAHTMAIKGDGSLWGWGYNRHGQIGDGTTIDRHNPVMISNNVVSVSVGVSHTMAIGSNGSLWGWGQNGGGSLGDGTTIDRHSPILIANGVVSVSASAGFTMAIRSDGSLWSWGWNDRGRLGNGTGWSNILSPTRVLLDDVTSVSTRGAHTLAVTTNGDLFAWGSNSFGQIGEGRFGLWNPAPSLIMGPSIIPLFGDVNGDGIVDWYDLIQLLMYLVFGTNGVPINFVGADVNTDGVVDADDALLLYAYLRGEPVVLGPQPPEQEY